MAEEQESRDLDNAYKKPDANLKDGILIAYPFVKTVLAFVAFAATFFTANLDIFHEYGFVGLVVSSSFVGLMLLIPLKLIAIPCAFFVSMRSGLSLKFSYYKVLELIYYIPYVLFFVMLFLFLGNYFINTP